MRIHLWLILLQVILERTDELSFGKVRCKSKFSTSKENTRTTPAIPSKFQKEYFSGWPSVNRKFHHVRPRLEIITKTTARMSSAAISTSRFKYATMTTNPPVANIGSVAPNISPILQCPSKNALYFPSTMVGTKSKKEERELSEKFSNLRNFKKVSIGAALLIPAFVHEVSFMASPRCNLSIALGDQLPLMKMAITDESKNVTVWPKVVTSFVGLEVTSDDDDVEVYIKYLHIGVIPDICCEIRGSNSSSLSRSEKKCNVDQRCINLSVSEIECIDI